MRTNDDAPTAEGPSVVLQAVAVALAVLLVFALVERPLPESPGAVQARSDSRPEQRWTEQRRPDHRPAPPADSVEEGWLRDLAGHD